jgi:hypothetical protein
VKRIRERGVRIAKGSVRTWNDPVGAGDIDWANEDVLIHALLYADDTALVALNYEDLYVMTCTMIEVTREWGLTVSIDKTKMMVFGDGGDGEVRQPVVVGDRMIEEVSEFKYLGSVFTSVGDDAKDCRIRANKAWGCFHRLKKKVWRQRNLSFDTKMRVFKMSVIPTMLYG